MKKVKEILFNDEKGLPIYVLENGEKRVPWDWATGSCWVTTWISEEKEKENLKKQKERSW